jgi:hypothetical protein
VSKKPVGKGKRAVVDEVILFDNGSSINVRTTDDPIRSLDGARTARVCAARHMTAEEAMVVEAAMALDVSAQAFTTVNSGLAGTAAQFEKHDLAYDAVRAACRALREARKERG